LIVVRRRAWIVLASIAIAVAAAYGVTQLMAERYEATATLFVGPGATTRDATIDVQYASLAQAVVTSYARLIETRAVVNQAARRLSLAPNEVAGHFKTGVEEGVQVITITADASSGPRAAALSNALAAALTDSVAALSAPSSRHIGVQQVDRAVASGSPASPVLWLNLVFGALAGLLTGVALAAALERLDQRIRTPAEAETALGLPVVGAVPRFERKLKDFDAVARHADPKLADLFRNLAIALASSADRRQHRTLLLTSVSPGDGKTTVAAQLGVALADHRRPTALIEADLRRPTFGDQFSLEGLPRGDELIRGLGSSLPASTRILPHLNVLAAGSAGEDPTAALRSAAFQRVLETAKRNSDLVLLDAPPALPAPDVSVLAQHADAVVLIVKAYETRVDDCLEAIVALNRLGAEIAGIVLTHARPSRRTGYYGSRRPAVVTPAPELKAVGTV